MGLAIYALPVRSKPFRGRFWVAAKRAVGAEATVAGESGVASRSATAVQDTMVAAVALGRSREAVTICRGYQLYGRHRTGNERQMPWFAVSSNDFQSIPITFEKL